MTCCPEIVLTPKEERLRKALVATADHIKIKEGKDVTVRLAGGWVRDKVIRTTSSLTAKLLSIQCNDLDVTLDSQTGYQFALKMKNYLDTTGSSDLTSITKIESNPAKSKHLETATTRFLDLDLDFVNLRSEEYTTTSRIPEMRNLERQRKTRQGETVQ
ncbi:CCA tRNA nucleotidyltransferase, mitochondrial [Neolecta irregularis DAH-3]|uniref:CCA tRNA nucleotidyltransferase, mitochondrial n=1 Tax=Neolecta irregularis (strain DAH-3) TaxID=1198029 RepID=A0A1U7LLB8_NEOID|nr:CCA tRNA nucleotidyltransferase, mitochondrial [Neolecta irregularis DAH-3]|eukprot:OLL23311.1 CCA tRNA nucleotidyltransferase, mitochondrial [Neolecta irregularis DAH-3]